MLDRSFNHSQQNPIYLSLYKIYNYFRVTIDHTKLHSVHSHKSNGVQQPTNGTSEASHEKDNDEKIRF